MARQYLEPRVQKIISDYMDLINILNSEIGIAQRDNDKELRDHLIGNLALLMRVLKDGETTLPATLCNDQSKALVDLFNSVNENLLALDVTVEIDKMKEEGAKCDCDKHKDDED